MQTEFHLTPKQAEYIKNANHRWNVACGAVRSGKSYCQISYCIPARLMERKGKRGLRVFLGATRANIERNLLQPLRDIYGDGIATSINSQNYCKILGEKVYCIGADNVRQVAKIRGSEIAYCAIDEATDINEEVFEMLKSRLSLPWSCCDITSNPSSPNHYFKKFLDSREHGVDIYLQEYQIYDNPFLPEDYIKSLEAEYAGTVWYDRYILGKWTLAEGLIYPMYQNAIEYPGNREFEDYVLSVDYGTLNATAAILWGLSNGVWWAVDEYYYSGRETGSTKTDAEYVKDFEGFCNYRVPGKFFPLVTIVDPTAASFIAALKVPTIGEIKGIMGYIPINMFKIRKANNSVIDGIRDTAVCMQNGVIKISPKCKNLINELSGYVWDSKSQKDTPVFVNDHACDAVRYFVKTMKLVKDFNRR